MPRLAGLTLIWVGRESVLGLDNRIWFKNVPELLDVSRMKNYSGQLSPLRHPLNMAGLTFPPGSHHISACDRLTTLLLKATLVAQISPPPPAIVIVPDIGPTPIALPPAPLLEVAAAGAGV